MCRVYALSTESTEDLTPPPYPTHPPPLWRSVSGWVLVDSGSRCLSFVTMLSTLDDFCFRKEDYWLISFSCLFDSYKCRYGGGFHFVQFSLLTMATCSVGGEVGGSKYKKRLSRCRCGRLLIPKCISYGKFLDANTTPYTVLLYHAWKHSYWQYEQYLSDRNPKLLYCSLWSGTCIIKKLKKEHCPQLGV